MVMPAYYNEFDKHAAAWIRNLIARGLIAPGDVDERDIRDVHPDDLRGYAQCHFFAGIGVWSYALRRAGWPDDRQIWTASCPCQPFSAAGAGEGFVDERHLWPHLYYLIQKRNPAIVIGEQVASKDADPWLDLVQDDMEALGAAVGAIAFPSAGIGAPHIRDRTYWVGDSRGTGLEGHAWYDRIARRKGAARPASSAGVFDGLAHNDVYRCLAQSIAELRDAEPDAESRGGSLRLGDTHGESTGRDTGGACGQKAEVDGAHARDDHRSGDAGGLLPVRLADAERDAGGRQAQAANHIGQEADGPADRIGGCGGTPDGLADTDSVIGRQGCEPGPGSNRAVNGGPWVRSGRDVITDRPGPTNGVWGAADWLLCRDGKWRPVEPGTFPLAHGLARGMGSMPPGLRELAEVAGLDVESLTRAKSFRVGGLRGYGNAINAIAAEAFISCLM